MSQGVRSRLGNLKTDDEFDAFCLDEYRDVRNNFPSGATRQRRINLLLESVDASEVDHKLTAWLEGRGTTARHLPVRRNLIWALLAGAAAQALIILIVVLGLQLTRSQPQPPIIVVPIEQLNQQLVIRGLTRERLDSPEQFAAKVHSAGLGKLRYEVGVDRDQETKELRRLVLALRIQNDQLVAATQYLLDQAKKWQHGVTPQDQLLGQLARGIEEETNKQILTDIAVPITQDMARLQEDMSQQRPQDMAKLNPDMTVPAREYRPRMVFIRPGKFLMGSPPGDGDGDEQPQHKVLITVPFLLSQTEVTQGQYWAVTGTRPPELSGAPDWAQRPVENVSWLDAIEYCNRLSQKEGLAACYIVAGKDVQWPKSQACSGYRLPTEAEWEYAARAGQSTEFAGSNDAAEVAWNQDTAKSATHRVATKKANAWGMYDMSGNVSEWVWDCYAPYEQSPDSNPRGPLSGGSSRVFRGGSWDFVAWWLRVAGRGRRPPTYRDHGLGFRISKSIP